MTQDEALKLALEALQKIYIAPEHEEYIRVWWPACEQAIPAIKEALAQPEQDSVAMSDYMALTEKYAFLKAQRKPLTDEEIQMCYETTGHYQTLRPQDRFAVFALARGIEAAHGIKE